MENLIFGLGVMVIGLLVVFLGLIILIVFIKVLSFITDRSTGEKKPEKAKPAAPVVSAPPVADPAPAASEGVSAEVIAAITAAIAAVTRKDAIVTLMILPARRALTMFAIAEEIEQNTIGTTTQNIMLINSVPSGSRLFAPGHTAPTTQPAMIASSILRMNQ